ncbi:MAG: zinc ribbon domain-containing protein [Chloroflexi bacterium]|nr:zinc ribbon domain-containing protein [Chloroflexota bacterium]
MFCVNCGTQLPDDANFCFKCGKPQRDTTATNEPTWEWETCEIRRQYSDRDGNIQCYWARAVGPGGEYTAWQSQWFGWKEDTLWHQARGSVVETLIQDGWQHIGRGSEWDNDRFRRQPGGRNSELCEIVCEKVKQTFMTVEWKFWAMATRPEGIHCVGESPVFKDASLYLDILTQMDTKKYQRNHKDAYIALENLESNLISEGWGSIGVGCRWWAKRFKRDIK